jgi:DNA-binding response OmpR family regulator
MVVIMQTLPKVLLVEDDRSIASALSQALQSSYDVDTVITGQLALYKADMANYDILVLDLDLPDMSGLAVCQRLREGGFQIPILVLTADGRTLAKINLLDAGANDYLTKPFSLGEFKARLRALTRTNHQPTKAAINLAISGIELNRKTHEVTRDGTIVKLRRKEFAMLECLMEHAGSVVTRRALTRYAWHGAEDLWTNTVDVHIKHLRDKIDRPFDRPLIRTIHGIGYRLEVIQTTTKKN